jgi:23S rRNA (uracil1939-C5)-methyltransferase
LKSRKLLTLDQIIEVAIDRLAYHTGHGVGRVDGFVVFVPFSAPQDVVQARVAEIHKSYAVAEIKAIIQASPHRRVPVCPVAGRCGGCAWQQVTYAEQLRQKQQLLRDHLRKLLLKRDFPIHPLLPAPEEYRYRNRIQVHLRDGELGFYAYGSNRLVPVDDCHLAESELIESLHLIAKGQIAPHLRAADRLEIARGRDNTVQIVEAAGETVAGRFSQVNSKQNAILINVVKDAIGPKNSGAIWDLYCGSGNLTIPIADANPQVSVKGVELSDFLISEAKQSGHSEIEWIEGDVGHYLQKREPENQLVVILDPPRPGCDKIVRQQISRLRPERIIYVSCNPASLARDVEFWCEQAAYEVEFVQGLDMFPQTAHLEAVLALKLTK